MNRISGPNVIAPAMPTKKEPGGRRLEVEVQGGRLIDGPHRCPKLRIEEGQSGKVGSISRRTDDMIGVDDRRVLIMIDELEADLIAGRLDPAQGLSRQHVDR